MTDKIKELIENIEQLNETIRETQQKRKELKQELIYNLVSESDFFSINVNLKSLTNRYLRN